MKEELERRQLELEITQKEPKRVTIKKKIIKSNQLKKSNNKIKKKICLKKNLWNTIRIMSK